MNEQGYSVEWQFLRRTGAVVRDRRDRMAEVKDALRKAFDSDRATLGNDLYGADLARRLPAIEEKIFNAFDAYLDELDGTSEDLAVNAINYEAAERAGTDS